MDRGHVELPLHDHIGRFEPLLDVALFGLATLLALSIGKGFSALLGGLTGDTYGAINEIVESAILITAVGLASSRLVEPLTRFLEGSP